MSDSLLVIGLGHAGQRHAVNALRLRCSVIGYDPGPHVVPGVACAHRDDPPQAYWKAPSIEEAFKARPLGVIITTPPETHFTLAAQLASYADIPCLIEKPLAVSSEQAEIIIKAFSLRAPVMVGYQLRFHPSLQRLKHRIACNGGADYARVEFASKQWCSHTYPADLLLECSHEIDAIRWLLGDPEEVFAFNTGLRWQGALRGQGWTATFSLDGEAPSYRRGMVFYGHEHAGSWTFDAAENEQAYVDELRHFLAVCRGEQAPACTGRDGWWALRVIEAIRKSAQSGRWETV